MNPAIVIGNCNVAFDINDLWNFQQTTSVIGIESMIARAGLCCTQYYMTPVIYGPIKFADMEIDAFPPKYIRWYDNISQI